MAKKSELQKAYFKAVEEGFPDEFSIVMGEFPDSLEGIVLEDFPDLMQGVDTQKPELDKITTLYKKLVDRVNEHNKSVSELAIHKYKKLVFEVEELNKITGEIETKKYSVRYGDNPNQQCAFYVLDSPKSFYNNLKFLKMGKSGPSKTNLVDALRAMDSLKFFEKPTVAVMKHNIPSGLATYREGRSLDQIYELARDCDSRSAFGSVVVANTKLDVKTAKKITARGNYVEMVVATKYGSEALEILSKKKNLRIATISDLDKLPKYCHKNEDGEWISDDEIYGPGDITSFSNGVVCIQTPYLSNIKTVEDFITDVRATNNIDKKDPLTREPRDDFGVEYVANNKYLTDELLEEAKEGWYSCLGVRSNSIVFWKEGRTIAIGTGEQERVGAVEQAIEKAYKKSGKTKYEQHIPALKEIVRSDMQLSEDAPKELQELFNTFQSTLLKNYVQNSNGELEGSILLSDAFFPFEDSIEAASKHGVMGVVCPGGSARDYRSIIAANKNDMFLVHTGLRCFAHI